MRPTRALCGITIWSIVDISLAEQKTKYLTKSLKKTNGFQQFQNSQILWSYKASSSIDCAQRCRSDTRCVGFVHDSDGGDCEARGGPNSGDQLQRLVFQGRAMIICA